MSDALRKAAALLDLQRYDAAYEAVAEVLAGDPHDVQALALAAHISLTALREYQRAFDLSTTALASEPDLDLLWRLRAQAAYELVTARTEDDDARRELYRDCVAAARRAVELDPDESENHHVLAVVTWPVDPAGALAAADRALELEPDHLRAHLMRGHILWAGLNDPVRARLSVEAALRIDPESTAAIHMLARMDADAGDLAVAAQRLRRVAQLDIGQATAIRHELRAVTAEFERRTQRARELAGVDAERVLGELRACDEQRWRDDDPEAIARGEAQLRDELRDDPENVTVIRQLALLDWLYGRRRAAITRLRTIVKIDPDRGDEIAAQIAIIEAEEEQAAAAKAVREAEAEAARERIAERKAAVAARRARARRATRAEEARATRVRRPKRSMAGTLFLLPFFLIARLLLHSCATDSSGSEPHYTTPSPVVPGYHPWDVPLSGVPGIPAVPAR